MLERAARREFPDGFCFVIPTTRSARIWLSGVLAFMLVCAAVNLQADTPAAEPGIAERETATARAMEMSKSDPERLEIFLRSMPKGGDLHMHLGGAVYAERMIGWAAADHLCIEKSGLRIVDPPCRSPERPAAQEAIRNEGLYHRLIDAMSMRDFVPGVESGHDHFFAAFGHFAVLARTHAGDIVADLATQAAAQHVTYLEIMISPEMQAAMATGKRALTAADDFDRLNQHLKGAIEAIVPEANQDIAAMEAQKRSTLKCGTREADPGCQVTIRYLAQVLRGAAPAQVFAQDLLAFRLVETNPLIVGINLVEPEDNRQILADYHLQMRQLRWLHERHPLVKQSLHAGELTPLLVPPSDLRFHIKEAVEIAGALRIGHGVDIAREDDALGLMHRMSEARVLVEINLTSNEQILGVRGQDHPFMTYRALGVPVALSTDDQGVSRIDLTHEYLRAAATYGLSYESLKELSRNSLEYAFLKGASLWDSVAPFRPVRACADDLKSAECAAFIDSSDKARAQASLETAYRAFETSVSGPAK